MNLTRFLRLFTVVIIITSTPFLYAQSGNSTQVSNSPSSAFPMGTIWVNSDQQLQLESFSNKILVIVFSDINSIEAGSYISEITKKYKKYPQIQLIEVLRPSTNFAISRKNLVQYAQKTNALHPIAMLPNWDLFGFHIPYVPTFAVYNRSAQADHVGTGHDGYVEMLKKLDDYCADTNTLAQLPNNQVITEISGASFADPVIENPHRIAVDKNDHVYVIDQAHNRIINFDYYGKVASTYGNGSRAYLDGLLQNSAFNNPQGICYGNGTLYVADTYNHSVRAIDVTEGTVSTLVGNQRTTREPVNEINGTKGSIGLPMDVTFWNDHLYVASGTTQQIFEVNERTGVSTVVYQAKLGTNGSLHENIVQIFGGSKALYFVTSWGNCSAINKKGELLPLPQINNSFITSICEVDGILYASTLQNEIYQLNEKNWKSIAGQAKQAGFINGTPEQARFHWPSEILEYKGQLLIADAENHAIRTLSLGKNRRVQTFQLGLSRELIIEKAANTDGELVMMDTIYVGRTPSEVVVHLNILSCAIAAEGNNEVHIVPFPGFSLNQEVVKENAFRFKVDQRVESEEVNIELYLTIEDPAYPGVYLIKRSYLNFPIVKDNSKSGPQEVVYDMHIWPY
jgi:hypothetical protein